MLRDTSISAATREIERTQKQIQQAKKQNKRRDFSINTERLNEILKNKLYIKHTAEYNSWSLEDKMVQDIIEARIKNYQRTQEDKGNVNNKWSQI